MPKIAPDATIADILSTLDKPEEYLRGIVGNLNECQRTYGDAWVRIGITGRGIVPHYRVEMPAEAAGTPVPWPWKVFNGRNHKTLVDEDLLRDEHWSKRSMTLEETRKLLGEIRMMKRNR